MASKSPDKRQRILLVTGMLGAGKTTALRELEDRGWEAIDIFPIRFLQRLIEREARPQSLVIGFDSRTQDFSPADVIKRGEKLAQRSDIDLETIFLDCSDEEIERRFNETRRPHFMASDVPVSAGIAAERKLMAPLREWAGVIVDTTHFSTNDLQQRIRELFAATAPRQMTVTVSSFGFSRGMPPVADLMFDMRFLDNPHWDPALRELTGLDAPVGEHIKRDPGFEAGFSKIRDLLLELLPRYAEKGKSYVNIALGCTGGRHRSVYTAEQIAKALREAGFSPTILHRNLASTAAGSPKKADQP